MTTSYPGGLDSFTNPTGTDNQSSTVGGRTHSAMHADINDAMEAVQAELGANPSGPASTVAARFAALDTLVGGKAANDTRVFDAVAYGALVDGSTNDTAAWQAAIDACAAAGGGVVTSSKNGVSVISGALQDTSGANAQIVLPSIHVTSGEQVSVVISGLTPPPSDISVIGSVVLPDNHLVLKSTLSSGTGAVIGVKGPSGSPGGFSNVHVEIHNLTVRMPSNPTNSGIDLRYAATEHVEAVNVDVGTYDVSAVTEPTSSGSFGVRLPTNNNGARSTASHVNVVGFYNGVEHSEHANLDDVNSWGCKVGFVPTAANHASLYKRVGAYRCERVIRPTGAHALKVQQLAVEHAASGWYTTDYDIDDSSNYLTADVSWWSVLGGTGPHNSFTVNGATGVQKTRLGTSAGGGGSTTYYFRDRLTATAGDTTLTLGATPLANSPLVHVNGTLKWPTTDYTISTNVITFNAPLSGADVVTVLYASASSTASAATLTAVLNITDTFTRADSTSALGTTTTGAKTWTQTAGTWGISSNKAYVSSGTASQVCIAQVDAGFANCTIQAAMSNTAGGANAGIAFRVTDASNFYQFDTKVGGATSPVLYKCVAGTFTLLGTATGGAFVAGDVVTVVLAGTSITVKKNGTTVLAVTDSTFTTQTKHGLYIEAPSGTSSPGRLDDFSITN